MNFVVSLSQVYVLEVRWSEGTTTVVFRRYSDFFEFQVRSCYAPTSLSLVAQVHSQLFGVTC